MRLALVSNSTMSACVRHDQLLPAEFQVERRLPVLREPGTHPYVDYLRPTEDRSFPTIERSGDSRLAAMERAMNVQFHTLHRSFTEVRNRNMFLCDNGYEYDYES